MTLGVYPSPSSAVPSARPCTVSPSARSYQPMARSRSRTTTWTGPSRSVAGSTGASATTPPEEVADQDGDQQRRAERARVLETALDDRARQVGRGQLGLGRLAGAWRGAAAARGRPATARAAAARGRP